MSTIPASQIVKVTPNVLSAGGNALDLVPVILTESTQVPIGDVQPFATPADVGAYFGLGSTEAALATVYFNGFNNSNIKPGKCYFAQYPASAVVPYLRGGTLAGVSLTALQAFPTGTLTITMNGVQTQAASVNLASATSFSNAATIIQAAFNANAATSTASSISGTTLTVGGTVTGAFAPGQLVTGVGVTPGSYIVSQLSGTTGGDGTYQLSASSTVAGPEAIDAIYQPAVTYDSTAAAFVFKGLLAGADQTITFASANTLANDLKLTEVLGAVTSQGAAAATPGTFMDGVVAVTTDFATFMTAFDPDNSGNTNKLAFAAWCNGQGNRYCYVCWDIDDAPSVTVPASSSLGQLLKGSQYSGTCLIGNDAVNGDVVTAAHAAFVCGAIASIDFTETNGRTTMAFRYQSGLAVTCTGASAAANLTANGYNFVGAYGTANDQFNFLYPGSVSGLFEWLDSYVNQIWLNNQFQLALMVLLTSAKSIPYNRAGYAQIEAACMDVILQGLNFGAFRPGVTLSQSQAAQVNANAGVKISDTLQQQGWYFQVKDASPQVRAARQSPPCTFWYMDGQSVQQINLTSVLVQ